MTAPDFAAILAAAMTSAEFSGRTVYSPPRAANHALATRVPALCPTCDGTTVTHNERHEWADISCPDCPTIGRLLAIGAAVMTGIVDVPPVNPPMQRFTFGGTPNWQARDRADGAAWMLAQLRAVQP